MPRPDGVWLAYDEKDWSACRVFRTELPALRHAIATRGQVKFIAFGSAISEPGIEPKRQPKEAGLVQIPGQTTVDEHLEEAKKK